VATVRWRLLVAYDGSGFRGFAAQPGVPTVAGALADALARTTRAASVPMITCAGRTDAGVHARGQVVHVDLPATLPNVRGEGGVHPMGPRSLVHALNRQLAPAVVVRRAEPAPPGFDARHSATARRYRYLVYASAVPDPLLAPLAWHVADPLDLHAMASAADSVIGEHDFRAFCRRPPGTTAAEPITRRVTRAGWSELGGPELADATGVEGVRPDPDAGGGHDGQGGPGPAGRLLRFEIEAGSFCHQMVRSLVATLVDAGRGKANAATVTAMLRSGTRAGAPRPAPAHGLCLVAVAYNE